MDHASLYARALQVTPGGVHSPVRAFRSVGGLPIFMQRADGARLVDVTGNSLIDFCQSFGPLILGHRDRDVAAAAAAALEDGWTFGCCEPYSLALAEWIVANVPWAERVRFVSSGTEAVMSALRVARAATGRSRVLKFEAAITVMRMACWCATADWRGSPFRRRRRRRRSPMKPDRAA